MDIIQFLKDAVDQQSSDVFIIAGRPITFKVQGNLTLYKDERLDAQRCEKIVKGIYFLASNRDVGKLMQSGDDDFSFALPGVSRFRVSAYKQRGSLAAVIRVVTFDLPEPEDIHIPPAVLDFTNYTRGLVLVTGPAGSGKSTTLACIINRINSSRNNHIVTLEDPIEYLHSHKKSIVSQREISGDTDTYAKALRAALRQSPDVILLGEMRDHETINIAMTAAETGHLVLSTVHTIGAANTIDRIIDTFPPNQQHQIRIQLSMVLQAIVSQQLIQTEDNRLVPAFEIMIANGAIRNMIRESKVHQIDTVIQSSSGEGMVTMDTSLLNLYKAGTISERTVMTYATNAESLEKRMKA